LQGWRKAGEQTCGYADQECEKQQARVNDGLDGVRCNITRQECDESSHGERGQHDAEQSTSKREKDAVGEKLPTDPPSRRAQCQPCADLPVASRSARQKETSNIQAGRPTILP
jgi:hypothetical protein